MGLFVIIEWFGEIASLLWKSPYLILFLSYRATYGTTKYCSFFLKGQQCLNQGCQFLHEPGEEADSFTKDELIPQSKVTPKPPPFPYGSDGAEDKLDEHQQHHSSEESAPVPAPTGWAKPTGKAQTDEAAFPDALHSAAAAAPSTPKPQTAIKRSSSTLATVVSDTNTPPPNNPAMFAPPSADVVPAVKPLKYIALQLDPLVINLAMSPRQPKYSGPFDPFREDSLFGRPPKAMGNSKSNELGGQEDVFGMQRGVPGNVSQPSAQDAFRSAFPNVNVVYGTPAAGQQSATAGANTQGGMGRAMMGNGANGLGGGALGFPKGAEGLPGNNGLPSQYENWEMGKSAQRL
jgi:hypothetical protein